MVNPLALAEFRPGPVFPSVAAHEFSHVYQYTLGDLGEFDYTHSEVRVNGPAWMQEGIADFHAMTALAKGGIWPYHQRRRHWSNEADAADVRLGEMETYNVLLNGHGRWGLAVLGAEFLAAESSEEALFTYWALLGPETTWQQAFETSFGMTIGEFYGRFEEHRAAGFPR